MADGEEKYKKDTDFLKDVCTTIGAVGGFALGGPVGAAIGALVTRGGADSLQRGTELYGDAIDKSTEKNRK